MGVFSDQAHCIPHRRLFALCLVLQVAFPPMCSQLLAAIITLVVFVSAHSLIIGSRRYHIYGLCLHRCNSPFACLQSIRQRCRCGCRLLDDVQAPAVVVQRIAGEEGRPSAVPSELQTADCDAGLVIDCLSAAQRQTLNTAPCFFGSEAVRCHLAVFAAADRADSLVRAVCRAAVAILSFRMAGVTLTDSVGLFHRCSASKRPDRGLQHIAGEEGRLIRRALELRPQAAQDL